jgi:hypothetical protein
MTPFSFHIIVNEAAPLSWPDVIWTDAKRLGAIHHLDSNTLSPGFSKRLRHLHFSNSLNRKVWLPLKSVWDASNCVRPDDLSPTARNYILFQTGVKFSAHSLAELKRKGNACIVLYMPDNIRTMGIARNRREYERFVAHYHIDQVFSFDKADCQEFGCHFFDFYSALPNVSPTTQSAMTEKESTRRRVLYVGSCRSKERLELAHALYRKLTASCDCTFYLNGVADGEERLEGIVYNHPLTYPQVVDLVKAHDVIVELINGSQSGNTLRFKEAVCYDKLLLTNNARVRESDYFNPHYMQVFSRPEDVDLALLAQRADYQYAGDFSPARLMEQIIALDGEYWTRKGLHPSLANIHDYE